MNAIKISTSLASAIACLMLAAPNAAQAAPKVAASIAPIHSITAAIMKDVAEPALLVPPSSSPHAASMQPSAAKALQESDLVVWVGPDIEPFLIKPLETLATNATSLALVKAGGIALLPVREGGNWERHVHGEDDHDHDDHDHEKEDDHDHEKHDEHDHEKHDDHDHEKHDDHDHEKHDDHDHEKHDDHDHEKHDEHADEDHHDHDEGHMDSHIWLNPANGAKIAAAIAAELVRIDPENAEHYNANEKAFLEKLDKVVQEAEHELEHAKGKNFIVFHDAYQYLEEGFSLSATGSVMLHPGVAPGAARVREIREKLVKNEAVCLFSEPQFSAKIVDVLVENTDTKLGSLDPIGATLTVGPDLYPQLIAYNVKQLSECLGGH